VANHLGFYLIHQPLVILVARSFGEPGALLHPIFVFCICLAFVLSCLKWQTYFIGMWKYAVSGMISTLLICVTRRPHGDRSIHEATAK
jgi:hypothetical protein